MNTEEQWRDIKGFEGFYKVSNRGRVKKLDTMTTDKWGRVRLWPGRIMKLNGLSGVWVSKHGKRSKIHVPSVMKEAFGK